MIKEYTCILCPNSCEIKAKAVDAEIVSIGGAICKKGREYVEQELIDPQRSIATTVIVEGGNLLQASVRLTIAVPKNKIFDVMNEIKKVKLIAPVEVGQIIIKNILGLNADVIATKNIKKC